MVTGNRRSILSLLALLLVVPPGDQVGAQESVDYQDVADRTYWGWHKDKASLMYAISSCGGKYAVRTP